MASESADQARTESADTESADTESAHTDATQTDATQTDATQAGATSADGGAAGARTSPRETLAGATALAGTVVTEMSRRTRPVVRLLFSPLLDIVLPMIVAEGVRRTDLAAAITKDVEAALAKVDMTAIVLERVDLDEVVKTAVATADPHLLAERIAEAQDEAQDEAWNEARSGDEVQTAATQTAARGTDAAEDGEAFRR